MKTNVVFDALLVVSCSYALWRGGGPERAIAAVFVAGVAASHFALTVDDAKRFSSVESGVAIVDCVAIGVLVLIALVADRFWTLGFAGAQLLGTAGHLLKFADPHVTRWGYAFAIAFVSYPMIALLVIGTFNHRRRLKRFGHDRSWSWQPPGSPSAG